MSKTETNTAVVRRFYDEVVNGGDVTPVDELMTPDYTMHGGSLGEIVGLPAFKAFFAANGQGAFTGMRLEVRRIIAQDDEVFVLFTNSGTNTGPFMDLPPTGRHAQWNGTALYRFEDGRIAESTYVEDLFDLLLQLGVTRLPAA
ncbi:ester cyclase [Streptomyces liangshanensis]|uniref:ester cyclase n=1 Tax=Streptomyces liangshanensis TaxID=2717324 RepID=UPI0036D7881E